MALEEKRAWIMLVVSLAVYAVYAAVVLGRLAGTPVADVAYAATMIQAIIGSIVATIVLNILAAIVAHRGVDKKDVRDKEISRLGDHIGQSFVVIGGVVALLLAMREVDYFWIANVIYLCFVLSAALGSVAKIAAYRWGFQSW
jgi:hypothetical protein